MSTNFLLILQYVLDVLIVKIIFSMLYTNVLMNAHDEMKMINAMIILKHT